MTTIPNLWPKGAIRVDVVSPVAILGYQASQLSELTKGLLRGEVLKVPSAKHWTAHRLDVVAPTVGNIRRTLLKVQAAKNEAYPVSIIYGDDVESLCQSEDQFRAELTKVLSENVSTIHSLIAMANDAQNLPSIAMLGGDSSTDAANATDD